VKPATAVALLALAACSRDLQTKEAVRQGVIDHLSSRKNLDLDMSAMEVEVTSVMFRPNEADATVAFRPRGSSAPASMQMRYSLERKGNQWVVKGKQESGSPHGAGGPAAPPPPPDLPAGHPPIPPSGGKP
jgi:hypothetical protein